MKTIFRLIYFIGLTSLGLVSLSPPAFAARLYLIGGATWQRINSATLDFSRQLGPQVGIATDWIPITLRVPRQDRSTHFFGFEFGAFYFQAKSFAYFEGADHAISSTGIHFPLIARFWINKSFSIGAGGYYFIPLSEPTDSPTGGESSSFSESPSSDYGMLLSLKLHLVQDKQWWFLETRYQTSFTTKQSHLGSYYTDSFSVLLGIQFGPSPYDRYHLY